MPLEIGKAFFALIPAGKTPYVTTGHKPFDQGTCTRAFGYTPLVPHAEAGYDELHNKLTPATRSAHFWRASASRASYKAVMRRPSSLRRLRRKVWCHWPLV